MPIDPGIYMKLRYSFAQLFDRSQEGLSAAMLGMAGYTALYIVLQRRLWAAAVAILLYAPVVVNGMFVSEAPLLDSAIGFLITTMFVVVIARSGLLATTAALVTHFLLLHAAVTTELSSWRMGAGLVPLGTIVVAGLVAVAIAAGRFQMRASARFS
jgi:hypothetical protein